MVLSGAVLTACSSSSTSAPSAPTGIYAAVTSFSGPLTAGSIVEPESARPSGIDQHGYVEQEFVASGTAHSFTATSAPSDGRWSIQPSGQAPYATRIIVRRPKDPAKFSGTVVVEWMNVSGGESSPDWDYLNPYVMDAGDAYVSVSAQALGVNGGTPLLGGNPSAGLVHQDPARYGSLDHPGDQYALDIFAQIGRALRGSSKALGPLEPRHVVAVGESQSAFYLTTFADAIQPNTDAFDGLFIHSRGGGAAQLDGASITAKAASAPVKIRTDLTVPVFMFETQTDVDQLGYSAAQQPNTALIRTWEVAGTSHADTWVVGNYASQLGCKGTINDGPQHTVIQAAFAQFTRWVTQGTPPASPPPLILATSSPVRFSTDAHGNVRGGVRSPAVDVPVATLTNAVPPGSSTTCTLFGQTIPFLPTELRDLYGTKAKFLAEYTANLDKAIAAGYVLKADREGLLAQAEQVDFGSSAT